MTITHEQLALAAKAAGIAVTFDDGTALWVDYKGVGLQRWKPNIDQGQLLDLAMACRMELDFNSGSVCYLVGTAWNAKDFPIGNFPALAEAVILAASEQQQAKGNGE